MPINTIVKSCLSEIQRIWCSTPEQRKPWGAWIAYHQPIKKDVERPDTDVISAWFLSKNGIQQRGAWAYVRFQLVHSGKYWSTGMIPMRSSPVFGSVHQKHEIGLASFAYVRDEPLIYLDYMWGGTYGLGSLYKIESSGNITFNSRIWIS